MKKKHGFSSSTDKVTRMKKFVVLLASFVLSSGVAIANPNTTDCGDDDTRPITVSKAQN